MSCQRRTLNQLSFRNQGRNSRSHPLLVFCVTRNQRRNARRYSELSEPPHSRFSSLIPRLRIMVTGCKTPIPKPSAATTTCERKMRCISVAQIFIQGITRVGAACMATVIIPARLMTIWAPHIGAVGEFTVWLKRQVQPGAAAAAPSSVLCLLNPSQGSLRHPAGVYDPSTLQIRIIIFYRRGGSRNFCLCAICASVSHAS